MDELKLKSVVYGDKILVHTMLKENNIHSVVRADNQRPNTLTKVKEIV